MTSVHLIPTKQSGDPLFAREVNALVNSAKAQRSHSFHSESVSGNKSYRKQDTGWVLAKCDESVPAFSVFVLKAGDNQFDDVPRFTVDKVDYDDEVCLQTLFTNGGLELAANKYGWVRPIGYNEAFKLKNEGTTIADGAWVGVKPETFGVDDAFNDRRYGLLVLASDSDFVWVVRVENGAFVAKTTEVLTAMDGDEFGFGNVKVRYREPAGETSVAGKLHGEDLTFRAYNVGGEIGSEQYVLVTHAHGVGFVASPLGAGQQRSGAGMLRDTVAVPVTGETDATLYNFTPGSVELINSSDVAPVISAEVAGGGGFRALIANDSGIYRLDVKVELRMGTADKVDPAPVADPPAHYSFTHMILKLIGAADPADGSTEAVTTENACGHILHRGERLLVLKNVSFTEPAVTDLVAQLDPWFEYSCQTDKPSDRSYSRWVELNAGDSLSLWLDAAGRTGRPEPLRKVNVTAEMWLHYQSPVVELDP